MKKLFLFPIGISLGLCGGLLFASQYVQALSSVAERMKGRIVIQVEERGEAWYVHPKTGQRHYLGRPNDAFVLMRSFGMGIRDSDIAKIAVADVNLFQASFAQDVDRDNLSADVEISLGTDPQRTDTDQDGYSDKEEILAGFDPLNGGGARLPLDARFAKGRAGTIFLQVEKNGEAWYVNPTDQKRYYLGRPRDAFEVMRKTGSGILNKDLEKIPVNTLVGDVERYVTPKECGTFARFVIQKNGLASIHSCKEESYMIGGVKYAYVDIAYGPGMDCPAGCIYQSHTSIVRDNNEFGITRKPGRADYEIGEKFRCWLNPSTEPTAVELISDNDEYKWKVIYRDVEKTDTYGNQCVVNGYEIVASDNDSSKNVYSHISVTFPKIANDCKGNAACLARVGESKLDPSICAGIQDIIYKDGCYLGISVRRSDNALCGNIFDDFTKKRCYDTVARLHVQKQSTSKVTAPPKNEKKHEQSELPPKKLSESPPQKTVETVSQTSPVAIRVTVPTLSAADLKPGMQRVRIASFQIDSEATERVAINELVFSDQLFLRTNVALFSQEAVVINMKDTPLVRQGATLTTKKTGEPIVVLATNGSITIDVVGDIHPVIPARLHDVLPAANEHLSVIHIDARGETSEKTAIVTPSQAELTSFRFISVVDESKLQCTVSAGSFKQTGNIQCGRIVWELTPQTASGFLGDPRPFLMKYDTLYQFYKDFMGGSEPPGGKITIRENPSNPYPADANWQDSVIRTNPAFAKDQFVYLGNHDLQPYAPSFMHELGHIFGLTSRQKNAFIWNDFAEGNANLIGILPYLMAYDGTFTMGVDFWCTNKLKVAWPCDGTFSDFEMYPEWLGANKDLQEYEREQETFATLFTNPPADQNIYERGGKFMTMLTTLYTEWKKQGKASMFWDAYRKTQQFYFKNSDFLPDRWKNNDESFDLPADTILKMNTYLLLLSAYANTNILRVFESRWRFPILQKTINAYARIQSDGFTESSILREVKMNFTSPVSNQPILESSGLSTSYFSNATLSGTPVLTRVDRKIDFIWDLTAPFPEVPQDLFSARWEGNITPTTNGFITFSAIVDDGVRLWVNNKLLFEDWTAHTPKLSSGSIVLEQGRSYSIKIEYYDDLWGAGIRLAWSGEGLPEEVIPESAFSH